MQHLKPKVREAIDLAYDKKADVILNDGSLPAYFLVPEKFTTGPDGKDFRSVNKISVIVKIMQRKQKIMGRSEERAWSRYNYG